MPASGKLPITLQTVENTMFESAANSTNGHVEEGGITGIFQSASGAKKVVAGAIAIAVIGYVFYCAFTHKSKQKKNHGHSNSDKNPVPVKEAETKVKEAETKA